jgi:hypothetical protein
MRARTPHRVQQPRHMVLATRWAGLGCSSPARQPGTPRPASCHGWDPGSAGPSCRWRGRRHLLEGVAVTGDEQPGAAGDGGALEKLAFAVIHQSASRAKVVDALMAEEAEGAPAPRGPPAGPAADRRCRECRAHRPGPRRFHRGRRRPRTWVRAALDQHQPAQAPHQVQPQQRQPQSDRRAEILRRSSISRPASPRVSNSQWAASRQLGSSR